MKRLKHIWEIGKALAKLAKVNLGPTLAVVRKYAVGVTMGLALAACILSVMAVILAGKTAQTDRISGATPPVEVVQLTLTIKISTPAGALIFSYQVNFYLNTVIILNSNSSTL